MLLDPLRWQRPKVNDKKWSPALCSLLPRCWSPEFNTRPDFKEIVDIMMTINAEEKTRKERDRIERRATGDLGSSMGA